MADLLGELARLVGVSETYVDTTGKTHVVPPETLRACLTSLGYAVSTDAELRDSKRKAENASGPNRLPPWIVGAPNEPPKCPGLAKRAWHLRLEDGEEREGRGALPHLPLGRHVLQAGPDTSWLIIAPRTLPLPKRGWGIIAAVYGLRDARHGGLADYADLASAARAIGASGAQFLGINPVHAGLGQVGKALSPYSPSHRRRLSTAHIHAASEPAPPSSELIDYRPLLEARRRSLRREFDEAAHFQALERHHTEDGESLRRFATYEVLAEDYGPVWCDWPAEYRDPYGSAVSLFRHDNEERIRFHMWLQYLAEQQLTEAAAAARAAGMAHGLYLDLAVGTHPYGAETWADGEAFAPGVSLGAPPDAFSPDGQNWNLATFNPRALIAEGFASLAATLATQFRYAGMLRIDHILGFERAYWIPESGAPGTYVKMPRDAMLAVARLEAARADAVVVGEDLGNVPKGLREDLAASGILGCEVAMFSPERPGSEYREASLASFSTHDLPTWAGWRLGRDIAARMEIGPLSAKQADAARADRARDVARLDSQLGTSQPTVDDMHVFLARSQARLIALQAEDVFGVEDQPNLPGTIDEYPNWRRRLPVDVSELEGNADLMRTGELMHREGRSGSCGNDGV